MARRRLRCVPVNATELASDLSPFGLIDPLGCAGVLYRDPARLVKREGDDVLVFARDASLDKSRQKHGPVFVLGVNVRQDRARTTGPAGADVARHKKQNDRNCQFRGAI